MNNYPKYKCEFCGTVTQLRFDPADNTKEKREGAREEFDKWRCPKCRKKRNFKQLKK